MLLIFSLWWGFWGITKVKNVVNQQKVRIKTFYLIFYFEHCTMKTLRTFAIIIIAALISSCSNTITAEQVITDSINYHDPMSKWSTLNATLRFDSRFSFNDSVPEDMLLTFNNAEQSFTYHNTDRAVKLHYTPDTCLQETTNGNCLGYSWTYGFYPFIWGLPMKLKDPGVQPNKSLKSTKFNKHIVWEVQVNYTAENYWFYFDKQDYQLRGFKFIKNDSTKKGEIIVLNELFEINGIKLPKHRTWLHLDSTLIGTNEVTQLIE